MKRRKFLKGLGLSGLAAVLSGCPTDPEDAELTSSGFDVPGLGGDTSSDAYSADSTVEDAMGMVNPSGDAYSGGSTFKDDAGNTYHTSSGDNPFPQAQNHVPIEDCIEAIAVEVYDANNQPLNDIGLQLVETGLALGSRQYTNNSGKAFFHKDTGVPVWCNKATYELHVVDNAGDSISAQPVVMKESGTGYEPVVFTLNLE